MNEQPITTSKRLIHNTVFNVVTLVSNAIVGFFLIRFFLGQLGEVRYGVWLLVGGSVFRYANLLSMGLNSSINRYIPVYTARNDEDGVRRVISTSLFFFSIVAVVLAVSGVVISLNVGSWFAIEEELVNKAAALVLVVAFCFAFAMPLQPSTAILSGLQRYDIINLAVLVTLLLRTILFVVLLLRGYGLITMGLTFGISEIVVRIVHSSFVRRFLPGASLSLANIDFVLLKEMLAYGINTFLYAAGAIIIYTASRIIIGIFLGPAQISQFEVAAAGVLLLWQFLQAFTAAIKPAVSDLDARDDQVLVKEIAFLTQKYSLLFIIPAGCFLVAMGREFLWIWVGEKFQDPGVINTMGTILAILAVGHCLRLAQHSNFLVLVGRGQHRIFGILTALTALVCVSASVVAVKVLNWGLLGIAWSNFVPMALTSGVILPIYFNWKMRISAAESVRHVWRPALWGSLPAVALFGIWKYLGPPDSWLEIITVVVTAMILTLISSWFLSLTEIERKRFVHIVIRNIGT
ncbi:MAG: lipopolysaccharide biosynthesis protein [Sedimentisphaerales bacterium]